MPLRDQVGGWPNHIFFDLAMLEKLPLPLHGVEDLKICESYLLENPLSKDNLTKMLTNPNDLTMEEAAATAMNGLFAAYAGVVLNLEQFKTFEHTFGVVVGAINQTIPKASMDAIEGGIQNWFDFQLAIQAIEVV